MYLASKGKGIAPAPPCPFQVLGQRLSCMEQKGSCLTRAGPGAMWESCCILLSIGLAPIFLKRKLGAQKASVIFPRSNHLENGGVKMQISIKLVPSMACNYNAA